MDRSRPIVLLMSLLLASWASPAARAADAAWEFSVSVNPENRIAACTQVLASGATLSVHDRAVQDYNEAIRIDPKYALAYTRRGDAYYNRHAYAEARTDYDHALALDPIDSKAAGVPNLAPALCHGEYGNRSLPTTSPINFHIRNSSTNTIRVYWINFVGRRQWYADVLPNHDYNARSYLNHLWAITDVDDNCRVLLISNKEDIDTDIGD